MSHWYDLSPHKERRIKPRPAAVKAVALPLDQEGVKVKGERAGCLSSRSSSGSWFESCH